MSELEKKQYLIYSFTYEGIRHHGKITLREDLNGIVMLYDNHSIETTWLKRSKHRGKYMIINVVVKDDWNDMDTLGSVAASAWVCVYDKPHQEIIDEFEPDKWIYVDEENPINTVHKSDFYK